MCQPMLLESIQHVAVKTVAVNSGGKHCLALSVDGEVYSWGEGDGENCNPIHRPYSEVFNYFPDGKLGHGNKTSCDRPRIVEALRGEEV